jgi:type I restriction enzyme R subunit
LAKGILDAIDMDSYRVEKKGVLKIALADMEAEIAPAPTEAGGGKPEPELDRLSSIIQSINDQFGTLFSDGDRVVRKLKEEILPAVEADITFRNAKKNTPHNARMAHDQALTKAMQSMMTEDMQIYKAFVENESFRDWVKSNVFNWTQNSGPGSLS